MRFQPRTTKLGTFAQPLQPSKITKLLLSSSKSTWFRFALIVGIERDVSAIARDDVSYYKRVNPELVLSRLNHVDMSWASRPRCLVDTRVDDITSIAQWATNTMDDKPRMLMVTGVVGSGKSCLVTEIVNMYNESRQLGAYIFLDRTSEK